MVSLSPENQAKVRFHLGYNYSIPAHDYAKLNSAMTTIPDNWTLGRIEELIERCEIAYAQTAIDEGAIVDNKRQEITGDIIRTTIEGDRSSYNLRYRDYYNECNYLAVTLGIRNYRDIEQALDGY